jgi:hypothetical protein
LRKHPCAEENHGNCASDVHTAIISGGWASVSRFFLDSEVKQSFVTMLIQGVLPQLYLSSKNSDAERLRVWNPTLRKSRQGWGTHGMVSQKKSEEVWVTLSMNSAANRQTLLPQCRMFPYS